MSVASLRIRDPKYGWIPDLPDKRDFLYKTIAPIIKPLPNLVDLRPKCSPVENQGNLGSCTACALVGNLDFLKKKHIFSRLFLYYNERVIRRAQNTDSGASIRDGIKTLTKLGDCAESLWPYIISEFTVKPDKKAYADALKYLVLSYYRIGSISEMKHTLSSGYPFVFGFSVYESFESIAVAKTGIVPIPGPKEHLLGGHAVMAVGYDGTKNYFIVRNSWGASWGDHGYFYMPYEYLETSSLASDFWTIRGLE
jgi:C1A family cysteine protease